MAERIIQVSDVDEISALFGSFDENINFIQRQYGVAILSRGTDIRISGEEDGVRRAESAVKTMLDLIKKGETIN